MPNNPGGSNPPGYFFPLPNLAKAEYNMDAMSASDTKNQIRRVLFIWGVLTLLYFFITWLLMQFATHTTQERIFAALSTTVTYSIIAVSLGQNVMRQIDATNRALQAGIASQRETEVKLRQELAERQRTEETLRRINAELDALERDHARFDQSLESGRIVERNREESRRVDEYAARLSVRRRTGTTRIGVARWHWSLRAAHRTSAPARAGNVGDGLENRRADGLG